MTNFVSLHKSAFTPCKSFSPERRPGATSPQKNSISFCPPKNPIKISLLAANTFTTTKCIAEHKSTAITPPLSENTKETTAPLADLYTFTPITALNQVLKLESITLDASLLEQAAAFVDIECQRCAFTPQFDDMLTKCKQLIHLSLPMCTNINDSALGLVVKNNPKLKVLNVSQAKPPIRHPAISQIAQNTSITTLCIAGSMFSDAVALDLSTNRSICFLDISSTPIGDKGLIALTEMKQLTHLDISLTKVTKQGIAFLQKLKNLQALALRRCKDPGSFASLASLPHLHRLDLSNIANLSDTCLLEIASIESLRTIILNCCQKLTAKGLETFLQTRPHTRVHINSDLLPPLEIQQLRKQYAHLQIDTATPLFFK